MEPIIVQGKYGTAKIYAKTVDDKLFSQCIEMLNQEFTKDVPIVIMPDTHVGKGCMIGTTMKIKDKVCPNLVGVDLSCGMLTVNLGNVDIDFKKLDRIITKYVPLGFSTHKKNIGIAEAFFRENPVIANINLEIPKRSLGTLGGGEKIASVQVNSL